MVKRDKLTYVLFGKEAVELYNISINQIVLTPEINYKVSYFLNVNDFMIEASKWENNCIEISKSDYNTLLRLQKRTKRNKFLSYFFGTKHT